MYAVHLLGFTEAVTVPLLEERRMRELLRVQADSRRPSQGWLVSLEERLNESSSVESILRKTSLERILREERSAVVLLTRPWEGHGQEPKNRT